MATSTSHQRLWIRTLLWDLDLPVDVIGTRHARALQAAKLQARGGQSVDDFLTELTRSQASDLANALQTMKTTKGNR